MRTNNINQQAKRAAKSFSLFIFLFSFAFASCSKSDDVPTLPQSGEQFSTFSIAAPTTRGDVSGLSRYIVEAYEGNDFETEPLRVEAATGLLTTNNTLTVKYPSSGKLNVATGEITEIESEISRTYTNIGAIAQDGTLTTDYILEPLKDKLLLDLTVTLNAEPEKTIAAVPFQQSYKTNVKGEFYMTDGTWLPRATMLTATQQANCATALPIVTLLTLNWQRLPAQLQLLRRIMVVHSLRWLPCVVRQLPP